MSDQLKKTLGPVLLTLYGVGIMIGAGIYVLVGHAAGAAGVWAPLAFLVAGLVAIPSALSYAALSAAIPEAAGDSAYVEKGLNSHSLAMLVGFINIAAGIIGGAAVLRGGVGYLTALVPIDPTLAIAALGLLLTAIAIVGVIESLGFAAVMTLIEIAGLALVAWAGFTALPSPDWSATLSAQSLPSPAALPGIAAATVFAFFAFLGFDDLVNMAEEARDPARDMPRTILWSLAITTALYALVTVAAVRAVPIDRLAASERPLATVWEVATGQGAAFLAAIAVAAALNGVLAQIVMAARVLFGLGRRAPTLAIFHRANTRTGTPIAATALIGAATIAAALALPVATLAEYTTLALLLVFSIVNISLIGYLWRRKETGKTPAAPLPFRVPAFIPWLGLAGALALLVPNILELMP